MARPKDTPQLASLEEAITILFCLIDDAYPLLNPGANGYASLKKLSDSEILTLALLQQLRGVQSERSFLRDAQRFFSHLFPGVVGLSPSSLHRRIRKLRRFLEPLRRAVLAESSQAIRRLLSWTRRSLGSFTPGRSNSPRDSTARRGPCGARSPSTG